MNKIILIWINLYAKDLSKPKYKILIRNAENVGIKHIYDPNAFIECSNTIDDGYENINDYSPIRKRKILWHDCRYYDIKNFKQQSKNCLLGVEN